MFTSIAVRGLALAWVAISACSSEVPSAGPSADAEVVDAIADARVEVFDAGISRDAALVLDARTSSASDASVEDASAGDGAIVADASTSSRSDAGAGDDAGAGRDAGNRCASAADCIAGAELCGRLVIENNSVVSRCGPPNTSGPQRQTGELCAADAECSSGLCLEGLTSECSVVCQDANVDCPAGFACVSYPYNPGSVAVPVCNRACSDEDDCAFGACSTQVYRDRAGAWQVATVCQDPSGAAPLGAPCASAGDCSSGLCLTNTRVGVGCDACRADETCAGGDCVLSACTSICDDASDCAAGGEYTQCAIGINLMLPDGMTRPISACTRT